MMRDIIEAAYAPWVAVVGRRPAPMDADHAGQIACGQTWLHGADGVLVLMEDQAGLLLDNVAVRPGAQGRGIGRALIGFAEAEARRRGHAVIRLYTNAHMVANIELYERLGFRETRRHDTDGFSRVDMEKALA